MSNDPTPEEKARRQERAAFVQKCVDDLSEHWDCVSIFVTHYEAKWTQSLSRHSGSWHGRYGQLKEWMIYEDERVRISARDEESKLND